MQKKFGAMGSRFHINVVDAPELFLNELAYEIERLEALWSRFRSTSEISLVNSAEGHPVMVSPETTQLIKKMISAYELTGGLFNPGLLPRLMEIGYNQSLAEPGSTNLPKNKLSGFSPKDIELDGPFVKIPASATLDPGGIGKGLAADMLGEKIRNAGYDSYFVNAGGDLYGQGSSPDGDPWRISVENPFSPDEEICQITFDKAGVATSSNLKRVFNGASHLVDPNGPEAQPSNIATVTVISGSAARSEVLTKACMFTTPDKAFELIDSVNAAALIVTKENEIFRSKDWMKFEC